MPNKLTQKEASLIFLEQGYSLLETYQGSQAKMRCLCPESHSWDISLARFGQGARCPQCSRTSKKTGFKELSEDLATENYRLIELISAKTSKDIPRIKAVCPNMHEWSTDLSSWNRGNRCVFCSRLPKKYTLDVVEAMLEGEGYSLLDRNEPIGKKLRCLCPQNHQCQVVVSDWLKGRRCLECGRERRRFNSVNVKEQFQKEGYEIIDTYKNSATKMRCNCPRGHLFYPTLNSWSVGKRCPDCASENLRTDPVYVAQLIEAEGYSLMGQYETRRKKLKAICPEGHIWEFNFDTWKKGSRCGRCFGMNPTDEQKELTLLRNQIASQVNGVLKTRRITKDFQAKVFSRKIAEAVMAKIGLRPEGFHLDHIIPKIFFDVRNKDELNACWNIENLRWITASENCKKGHKFTDEDAKRLSKDQLKLLNIASLKPKRLRDLIELMSFCSASS